MDDVASPHKRERQKHLVAICADCLHVEADVLAEALDDIAEVHAHALGDDAEVSAVLERALHAHNVLLVSRVRVIQQLQYLRLLPAGDVHALLRTHELDRDLAPDHVLMPLLSDRLQHLRLDDG